MRNANAANATMDITACSAPVVVLVGDEEQKKEKLLADLLRNAGSDASVLSWAAEVGESPGAEFGRLVRDLSAAPLFGGCKVAVVRDGDAFLKRHAKSLPGVLDLKTRNRVVVLAKRLDGRTSFARKLGKAKAVFRCERPRSDAEAQGANGELVRAVVAQAHARGLRLEPAAAEELAGRTGNDLMLVENELEKLTLYLSDAGSNGSRGVAVSRAAVEAVVPRSAAYDQFRLFEEVAVGNVAAAVRRVRGMLHEGTTDRRGKRTTDSRSIGALLVALLHNRLRMLARFRELTARGLDGEQLRAELGVRNPGQMFFLKKEASLPLVRQSSGAAEAAAALAQADRGLKTSEPPRVVLESLVVRLASIAKRARSGASR